MALASVPAAGVADVVRRLDRRGVRTAIVNTAGFSAEQEAELRQLVSSSRILMHGPNCMGLINLSDATPIYTGGITSRVRERAGGPDRAVGLGGDLGDQFLHRRLFEGRHHRQRVPRDRRGLSALVRRRRRHVGDRPGPRIDPRCRPFRRRGRPRSCRRQVDGRPQGRPIRDRRAGDPGAYRRPDPQRRRLQGLRRALWHSRRRRLRGADRDPRGVRREPQAAEPRAMSR